MGDNHSWPNRFGRQVVMFNKFKTARPFLACPPLRSEVPSHLHEETWTRLSLQKCFAEEPNTGITQMSSTASVTKPSWDSGILCSAD